MNNQIRSAQQLAKITDNLVALFADYCERNASSGLANMLAAFSEHRFDLVLAEL
jgi:hypothetical protein